MAWEKRNNGRYYYRKHRVGKRVLSEYIGAGQSANIISKVDLEKRKNRKRELMKWKKQKFEYQVVDAEIDQLNVTIQFLVRAVLLISDYHPHKGQWRHVRYGKENKC